MGNRIIVCGGNGEEVSSMFTCAILVSVPKEIRMKRVRDNLLAFAYDWINSFYENKDIWPFTHRKKSQYT